PGRSRRITRVLLQGMLMSSCTGELLTPPPWVTATTSPWHDLPPPHSAGQVESGVNFVKASPSTFVVACEGVNWTLNVFPLESLFCRLNSSTTPGIPSPDESRASALKQTVWLQLVTV